MLKRDGFVSAGIRVLAGPSGRYNCHGLVFGSRRTNIDHPCRPVDIADLLRRDEFARSDTPQCGDIAVYRSFSGRIDHTGVVSRVESLGNQEVTFVISKWGALEEVEHRAGQCPYSKDCTIEYWRLKT
jgi:hypothetical protein